MDQQSWINVRSFSKYVPTESKITFRILGQEFAILRIERIFRKYSIIEGGRGGGNIGVDRERCG